MTPTDVLVAPSPEGNRCLRYWRTCLHGFRLEISQSRKQLISGRHDVLTWTYVEQSPTSLSCAECVPKGSCELCVQHGPRQQGCDRLKHGRNATFFFLTGADSMHLDADGYRGMGVNMYHVCALSTFFPQIRPPFFIHARLLQYSRRSSFHSAYRFSEIPCLGSMRCSCSLIP